MPTSRPETALRREIIETCLAMNRLGINQGTSGNVSARYKDVALITPSGVPYDRLDPADIVVLPIAGGRARGRLKPSSEWRFHRDIMAARGDVRAIVHTHSCYATAVAICRQDLPAHHYMVAVAGGSDIRCAEYATFGTQKLSDNALAALRDRKACLLANHGVIATGRNLGAALSLAQEVEVLAKQYLLARSLGSPVILPAAEMRRVEKKFAGYGKQPKGSAGDRS
jgi:L-fuculose-phosphate aldolase